MTGTTLGSLDYMSPEQVKSEPTDARSDLYSLGVSLYQMVTGRRMFAATSSYSLMEAHVLEIPRSPIEVQPTLPKALSDVTMMAVAKDPAQRFQTADALAADLARFLADEPIKARRVGPWERLRRWVRRNPGGSYPQSPFLDCKRRRCEPPRVGFVLKSSFCARP